MERKAAYLKYLNPGLKTLVFFALLWIIYTQLNDHANLFEKWNNNLDNSLVHKLPWLIAAILLLPLNLFFEAEKWRILVNQFEAHKLVSAIKSILTGITAGLITPASLGDYVGRLLYIQPGNNWKGIWSNLVGSIAQNLGIAFLGLAGLLFLVHENIHLSNELIIGLVMASLLVIVVFLYLYYHLHWLLLVDKWLPDRHIFRGIKKSLTVFIRFEKPLLNRVLLLSFLRCVVFVVQYLVILSFWGIQTDLEITAAICVLFLVQTIIPIPPVLGLLARGELAIILLGPYGENDLSLLSASFSLWIINLLFPAIYGWILTVQVNLSKTLGYEH